MNQVLTAINDAMYTYILLILLVGVGLYFTVRTKGVQLRLLKDGIKCMLEKAPEFPEGGARCRLCFEWSLARTAEAALKEGMNFCTTLTVSPHKSSRVIFEAGARFPGFEPWDFKKKDGFKKSVELSRRYGLYRQNFCGCGFSLSRTLKPFSS